MSVLIKGMEMPKNCHECSLCFVDSSAIGYCYLRDECSDAESTYLERRVDCPLVEVPTPHGRLIDASFEEAHYTSMTVNPTPDVTETDKRNSLIIIEALQMAKTIIEAEG